MNINLKLNNLQIIEALRELPHNQQELVRREMGWFADAVSDAQEEKDLILAMLDEWLEIEHGREKVSQEKIRIMQALRKAISNGAHRT